MARFIKLRRLVDYEPVTINIDQIIKVRVAERSTCIVELKDSAPEQVMESHDEVLQMITKDPSE